MKSVSIFCVLIFVMSEADNFVFDNTRTSRDLKAVAEQKVLLRKLQNFQRDDPKGDTKSVTWSEILADVLVNGIKISFSKNSEKEQTINYDIAEKPTDNFVTKFLGNILLLYKDFVFDKLKANNKSKTVGNEKDNPNVTEHNEERIYTENSDPKRDVEVIKSESNNGELCDLCGDEAPIKVQTDVCPQGQAKDDNGNCVTLKLLKYIFSIPNHCPIGQKADRLGYCRENF